MFKYLQDLDSQTFAYYDNENQIKFSPPVYEQRYSLVAKVLENEHWAGDLQKVAEFGCAEMKFVTLMKRINGISHILQIDIDQSTLQANTYKATPLVSDYLCCRPKPLRIDIFKGNAAEYDDCLRDTDAVVAIELIEHMFPEDLEKFPHNIFGCVVPRVAVFTTPNSDFNVILNLNTPNGFRHDDHKFEWSRKQFKDWANNICIRYPNYRVHFVGIGNGPPNQKMHGHVSQMCIFVRNDVINPALDSIECTLKEPQPKCRNYELLSSVQFPFAEDNRTEEEKILDEVKYHINRFQRMEEKFYNNDENIYEIPLEEFLSLMPLHKDYFKDLLTTHGYDITSNDIIRVPEEDYFDEEDSDGNPIDIQGEIEQTLETLDESWD